MWIRVVAGITCGGLAGARVCLARSMSKATKPRNRLLKKLPEEVEKLQQAYPEAKVELWSQDEHRIGLKPVLRRVWARKGSRVRAVVRIAINGCTCTALLSHRAARRAGCSCRRLIRRPFLSLWQPSLRNKVPGQTSGFSWFSIKRAGTRVAIS